MCTVVEDEEDDFSNWTRLRFYWNKKIMEIFVLNYGMSCGTVYKFESLKDLFI